MKETLPQPTPLRVTLTDPGLSPIMRARLRKTREFRMALVNLQASNDAPRFSRRCSVFAFSFFSFRAAATAEGAGV